MFSKKLIGVFLTAFAFAVIVSAPVTFDDSNSNFDVVDAVVAAFGGGGGDDGGGGGGGSSCFPAGTKITMANGELKNIEDVEVGEKVRSYDTDTESYVIAEVLELESPVREGYYSVNNDLLRMTNEHPIYTKKADGTVGWASVEPEVSYADTALRPIYALEVGDEIYTEAGEWVIVESLEYVEGEIQTYNLKSVSNTNTFFADGVLVHNKGDNDGGFGGGGGDDCGGCGGDEPGGDGDGDEPGGDGDGDDEPPEPEPLKCTLAFDKEKIDLGESATLTWTTENADAVTIDNDIGTVADDDSLTVSPTENTTYTLTATRGDESVTCSDSIVVEQPEPDPVCKSFTADPTSLPAGGGNVTLTWDTEFGTSVSIDNGVGTVDADDSTVVSVADDITYTLTVSRGNKTDTCNVSIDVDKPGPDAPKCDAFTVTPETLPADGGAVTLTWETTDADTVTIDNGVGTVAVDGTATTSVSDDTTFTLTAVGEGGTTTCSDGVTVEPEDESELKCEFSTSETRVNRGSTFVLSWDTIGATSVEIDQGIGSVDFDGSRNASIQSDTTFTLTASDGENEVQCTVDVDITSGGGGGGGSSSPHCELEISATRVNDGDEVTLTWDTRLASDVEITDDRGNVIITTDDLLSTDKRDLFDGEVDVTIRRDTTFTLLAERGSRDDECEVSVRVDDDVVVTADRTQGQVAGISLTAVPYTGFEAGPTLTFIFYALLAVWGLFVAYTLVIRENKLLGISLAGAYSRGRIMAHDASTDESDREPSDSEAASYLASATTPTQARPATAPGAPANLPTGEAPTIGYAAAVQQTEQAPTQSAAPEAAPESDELKELEDRAHQRRVLLSSDAMRHLIAVCPKNVSRIAFLDQVLAEAKITYPAEDGWVVLNLERMSEVCDRRKTAYATGPKQETVEVAPEKRATAASETAPVPDGSGSLAEAIVTGNISAAYQMIGNRPMFALADAAADLDAVYRARKGAVVSISDMLARESEKLSTEQIEGAINALTGAIDGTYTDEEAAVKMAILKAVKALS